MNLIEEHFEVDIELDFPDVSFGTATIENGVVVLDTYYDKEFLREIKKFNQREFDQHTKNWSVNPSSIEEIDTLLDLFDDWDIEYDSDVQIKFDEIKSDLVKERQEHQRMVELSKQKSLETDYNVSLPDDDLELYDFQKYGVKMLDERGKGLVADEMGTGKTVQVLAHLYNRPSYRPILIVCPSSVKINWKRETIKWTEAKEDDIQVLRGQNGDVEANKLFYIVNYSVLSHRLKELKNTGYKAIVFDESHYIKNHKAKRSKSAIELAEGTEHVCALSGTPMPNRPIELWTQLQALSPDEEDFKSLWGNNGYEGFAKKYCGARETRWGWDVNGASNLDELYNKLRVSIMIRRRKEDVLDELPKKRRITLPLEIENRDEYNEAIHNFRKWMNETNPDSKSWQKAEHLAKIEKLKQLSVQGKKEQMIKWLHDLVEQDGKVVIFAHHRDLQDEIYKEFKDKAVKVFGGMDSDKRQKAVDDFTNGDAEVCVVSLIAGGEGINLQVASKAVFTEVNWTPKEHRQAEDRIHRIGQENRCDVYYLIAENTIEEKIFELINEKQKIIDQSIDGISDESQQGMIVDLVETIMEE